jgi:hypothetical protein
MADVFVFECLQCILSYYMSPGTVLEGERIFQNVVTAVLSPIYQLVAAIAFVYFLYGAFMYLVDLNNPEKKTTRKSHLLYGTIGLFIIFSIGGLLPIFNRILGGMFTY